MCIFDPEKTINYINSIIMKLFNAIWVALFLQVGNLFAQSAIPPLNLKFGKPTEAEMNMTEYPLDTTATAVYLMQSCDVKYHMTSIYDLTMRYAVKFRIKILKDDGKKYGDIAIPFRYAANSVERDYNEIIDQFSAVAYNLNEKGKVVATRVNDNMIFEERVNEDYKVCKFSIPQVRKGTVIEVKYELFSPVFFQIEDYVIQKEIPVIYTDYNMEIPAVLQFNVSAPTANPQVKCSVKAGALTIDDNTHRETRVATNCYHIEAHNLLAVQKDDYIWCPSDYCARVECDLKSTQFPRASYQARRRSWEEIDELILSQEEIGPRLKSKSKFGDEIAASGIALLPTPQEKVLAAVSLLRQHVAWNGENDIVPNSANSVIKKKSGSTADLNMMLINMLNDLDIKSSPVYISTRRHGILPIHPSVKSFNTMIVAVDQPNGQVFYVDAARGLSPINVLNPNYYVKQARLVSKHRKSEFVDLTRLAQSRTINTIHAKLNDDGTLSGDISRSYDGNAVLEERYAYLEAQDSIAYVKALAEKHNIQIHSMQMEGHKANSQRMTSRIDFSKNVEATEDHIYLNPFVLLPMEESPFKTEERQLPIELPYKENHTWNIIIEIPEGYVVEETPKSFDVKTPDRSIASKYTCFVQENHIRVAYNFVIKDLNYGAEKYAAIKSVYDIASQRVNDMIVLKKK